MALERWVGQTVPALHRYVEALTRLVMKLANQGAQGSHMDFRRWYQSNKTPDENK
jgi:hypothetical protein